MNENTTHSQRGEVITIVHGRCLPSILMISAEWLHRVVFKTEKRRLREKKTLVIVFTDNFILFFPTETYPGVIKYERVVWSFF